MSSITPDSPKHENLQGLSGKESQKAQETPKDSKTTKAKNSAGQIFSDVNAKGKGDTGVKASDGEVAEVRIHTGSGVKEKKTSSLAQRFLSELKNEETEKQAKRDAARHAAQTERNALVAPSNENGSLARKRQIIGHTIAAQQQERDAQEQARQQAIRDAAARNINPDLGG